MEERRSLHLVPSDIGLWLVWHNVDHHLTKYPPKLVNLIPLQRNFRGFKPIAFRVHSRLGEPRGGVTHCGVIYVRQPHVALDVA